MMNPDIEYRLICDAIKDIPETFALRAFPSDTFKVSKGASFVNHMGVLTLYIYRMVDGEWLAFSKCSVSELRSQIVTQH